MVQDYAFGKYLGCLQVKFDENGVVTEYGGNPILLNNSIPEGEIFKLFIKDMYIQLHRRRKQIIRRGGRGGSPLQHEI